MNIIGKPDVDELTKQSKV